ncbi:hypothetical protein P872_18570 [Rhodonellum psychrophilum GCM71 = DSM 17998]|uniref:Uncharacterized protein n=2 Tax=Rhodonellum TaxID=336827 RepID=U5BP16_9BACT|nr:hypothetical protein P872_18570 [Rhodonellum psychrophilum GCM71 = DSM 17998]SDZ49081.1 hypothetical protein SAMN05444412_11751 [Rhodonellum ikkaensis]
MNWINGFPPFSRSHYVVLFDCESPFIKNNTYLLGYYMFWFLVKQFLVV